jgi:hypothetical protein
MATKLAQVIPVLRQAADTLRKQASRIEYLEAQVEARDRREDAQKLASQMHEKGIDSDVPFDRLAANLEKMAKEQEQEYITLRGAVDLVGPDMGTKQASLRNNDEERSSVGSSDLVRFIEGQLG